jgi:hypothetical protein
MWEIFLLGHILITAGAALSTDPARACRTREAKVLWWRKGRACSVVISARSCWAFSTTGSVEGINAILTGELVALSERQLLDCDTKSDNGCDGGFTDNAFKYIIETGGFDTEKDYPYTAKVGTCQTTKARIPSAITSLSHWWILLLVLSYKKEKRLIRSLFGSVELQLSLPGFLLNIFPKQILFLQFNSECLKVLNNKQHKWIANDNHHCCPRLLTLRLHCMSHHCSPTRAKPQIQSSLFALCIVCSNTQTLFSTCVFAR